MITVGDKIADAHTRHTVYTLRHSSTLARRYSRLVDQLVADLTYKLLSRAPGDGSFTRARLEYMLASTKLLSTELYKSIRTGSAIDLNALAEYEARFNISTIEDAYPFKLSITAITPASLYAATMSRPFMGKVLRDWWRDQEYSVQRAFQAAIRVGYAQGETLPQISARLRGIGKMTNRQIDTIVRTAVRHMSQTALDLITRENSDIIEKEEFVATLDGRTSAICRGLDGKFYAIGSGPRPPMHFNCRSIRLPVVASWATLYGDMDENARLSSRPFVADKRRVKDIPKNLRDSLIGSTTARSYNDWLRTQPRSFVDDVLGPTRAKIYLDGGLSLDKFVDRSTGREFNLFDLEKREKKAFKIAYAA